MNVGDMVIHRGSSVHLWEIVGIFLGATGQEDLIELSPVSHRPGHVGGKTHETCFVPEALLRGCVFARATRENI